VVSLKIYVEGGGNTNLLRTACRRGFSEFLKKTGLSGHMPGIIACGSRWEAFSAFSTAIKKNENAMLLVDSEAPVKSDCQQGDDPLTWKPWQHLKNRKGDEWEMPAGAEGSDCHFMVQCMEAWILADRETLKKFFGQGFNEKGLPPGENPIENIDKKQIYQSLENATKDCKVKAKYGKGEHSFKLLAVIDPAIVTSVSPWAKRFIEIVKQRQGR
jgi:hypothetical protein